jgi:hypothetical protein
MSKAYLGDELLYDSALLAPRTSLWLPGTSGNHVTCPSSAALAITGDLDLRWFGSLADWTTVGVYPTLIGKWSTAQHGYMLGMNDSYPYLEWDTDNAGGDFSKTSTAAPTVSDGEVLGIRVTLDVDTGSSTHEVKFYTSNDLGMTWTQLGLTVSTAGTTSIYAGTSSLYIGSHANNTYQMTGNTLKAEVRDGIDGTVVASPDFTSPKSSRFLDAQDNLWTINGSAWAWEKA